jgi:preprotein translocase subunit SecF
MRIFAKTPNFGFMAHRRAAAVLSMALIVISLASVGFRGLNYGMEFTGGLLLDVRGEQTGDVAAVRNVLSSIGLASAQVQSLGRGGEFSIRLPPQSETLDSDALEEQILTALRASDSTTTLLRVEFVGPQVGKDLAEQGSLAMLIALLMIFSYVMFRFRWKLALGAIVALIHDVIITVGFFSVFWISFDLAVLGSVLAVIGYSLNDTIVVFDRVRENFRLLRRGTAEAIVDASINQTLARTLVTGMTTLMVLVALLLLGGETLKGFSIALIVGIVIGTYSSIYVASATALAVKIIPTDLVPPQREQEHAQDSLP